MDRSLAATSLLLDLGDVFTKGMVQGPDGLRRFRYPSVVSHRLIESGRDRAELSLEREQRDPMPPGFVPGRYPRTRSYPGAERVLAEARPVPGARFAGWLATKYGADRQLLGHHPSPENVEALIRKAFLESGARQGRARLILVVDPSGAKAEALHRYAAQAPHRVEIAVHSLRKTRRRHIDLTVDCEVLDSAACAVASLPRASRPPGVERVLVVDVGYLRSKLAILSAEGLELLRERPGLGVADCVRRLLRDGRERGLVEDELAIASALERSERSIEIAGRRFDLGTSFQAARQELLRELEREVREALLEHFGRRGEPCRSVAVVGGGAAVLGQGLTAALEGDDSVTDRVWVTPDPAFLLLEGARRMVFPSGNRQKPREVSRV